MNKVIISDKKTAITTIYSHFCRMLLCPVFFESKRQCKSKIEEFRREMWECTDIYGKLFEKNKTWNTLYYQLSLFCNEYLESFNTLNDKEIPAKHKGKELPVKHYARRIHTLLEKLLHSICFSQFEEKTSSNKYIAIAQHLSFMRLLLSTELDQKRIHRLKEELRGFAAAYAKLNKDPNSEELLKNICTFNTFFPDSIKTLDFRHYQENTKTNFPLDMSYLMGEIWFSSEYNFRKNMTRNEGKRFLWSIKRKEKEAA